ncbi:MAG: CsbD family protein [Myxococcales bacterium]|nr:CsbD family protein [Myxococcales bacterium]
MDNSNWQSTVEGKWEQLKGSVRQKWGQLTDDDVAECKGNREKLIGKIMERQKISREVAEQQVGDWQSNLA